MQSVTVIVFTASDVRSVWVETEESQLGYLIIQGSVFEVKIVVIGPNEVFLTNFLF